MKYVSWITSEENYCEFFRNTKIHQEIFKSFSKKIRQLLTIQNKK